MKVKRWYEVVFVGDTIIEELVYMGYSLSEAVDVYKTYCYRCSDFTELELRAFELRPYTSEGELISEYYYYDILTI